MWSRTRIHVAAFFSLLGFDCAAWITSLPAISSALGLNDAQLSKLLLAGPIGNFLAFPITGHLVAKFGSRWLILVGSAAYTAAVGLPWMGFHFHLPLIWWHAFFVVFGFTGALFAVACNTQAGMEEKRSGRSIMSSCHALWSVASFLGGMLTTAFLTHAKLLPYEWRFGVVILIGAAVICWARTDLITSDTASESKKKEGKRFVLDGLLIKLGLLAMVFMACEGSVNEWSGIYFKDVLKTDARYVMWGYCASMAFVTIGRFTTDFLVERYSARRILHAYCLVALAGFAIALGSPHILPASIPIHWGPTVGYALAGLGLSCLVPLVFARAAKSTRVPPGVAITIVSSIGYLAFFLGPVLIGFLSMHVGLTLSLAFIAVLLPLGLLF